MRVVFQSTFVWQFGSVSLCDVLVDGGIHYICVYTVDFTLYYVTIILLQFVY